MNQTKLRTNELKNNNNSSELELEIQKELEKLDYVARDFGTIRYTGDDLVRAWFAGFLAASTGTDGDEREEE